MNAGLKRSAFLFTVLLLGSLALATPALAQSPWWHLTSDLRPAVLPPGGEGTLAVQAINLGDRTTQTVNELGDQTPIMIMDKVPPGMSVQSVSLFSFATGKGDFGTSFCTTTPQQAQCEWPIPVNPFEDVEIRVTVKNEGAPSGSKNHVTVSGGAAPAASLATALRIGEEAPAFGASEFSEVPEEEGGTVDARAGSHPFQLTTSITLNQNANPRTPPALPKNLEFKLPAGLIGNATALPQCSDLDFRTLTKGGDVNDCPPDTVVGVAVFTVDEPANLQLDTVPVPLFNLAPLRGEPARFGFEFVGSPVAIDTAVRTGEDYGVIASADNITELANFISSTVTLWGTPGDVSHNEDRGWGCLAGGFWPTASGLSLPCEHPTNVNPAPFLTLPTSCSAPFETSVEGVSWPTTGNSDGVKLPKFTTPLTDEFGRDLTMTGCNQLPFAPSLEVAPDGEAASTPTGLAVNVKVPQEVNDNSGGLASSSVKDISVTFPEGVTVNPASADGLEACSESEVGFTGFSEFNPVSEPGSRTALFTPAIGNPFCPAASKIGTVSLKVPVIKNPLKGALYLAAQDANPFGSLIAAYIVAEDPESGIVVKLPGEVSLNPVTGQITSTFKNSPQAPLEEAEIHLFGGSRAPFSTPAHCGTYTTDASFDPWSGGAPVGSSSSFRITSGPNGGACPGAVLPFAPVLQAGTTNINAGAFSPLVTTIGREDGNQNINSVQLHMPSGLSGILTGVPLCPEAQANVGTCGQASLIGHTTVSVGLGNEPFTVVGGEVFLTEKYEGAPFGLSIVNPAVAGPFNLGKVVVRAKIEVDPHTAQLTITTGEIPHILDGIPLQIKHVNVTVDRSGFTFNPTNCSKTAVTGNIGSVEGTSSPVQVPFQVTNCASLKFAPKFAVSTSGKTSKAKGASLKVKLTYPQGPAGTYANIARVKVDLPKQLPSQLKTLQKACLAKVFESNPADCPAESKVGYAKAFTPLIPVPLEGPAIFVSHGNEAFPSLIMVLQGYGVTVDLVGTTFISKAGITSSTFKTVPDQPISSFELNLPQGKYSALAANGNLCTSKLAMPTEFLAQNGAKINKSTPIAVEGCPNSISVSSHSLKGRGLTVSVSVPAAGKLAASGKGLSKASKTSKGRETITLTLHTTKNGRFSTKVKLTFTPGAGKDRRKQSKALKVSFNR
jgi:hypothetical protein